MANNRLAPRYFDDGRTLLWTKFTTFNGEDFAAGEKVPEGTDKGMKMRLWLSRRAAYDTDYQPVPQAEGGEITQDDFAITDLKNGYYEIANPYGDPVKIKGKAKAEKRAAEMTEAGEPADWGGVAITDREGGNGWYDVTATWIGKPLTVHGEDNAKALATRLRTAGAPGEELNGIYAVQTEEQVWIVVAPWLEEYPSFTDEAEAATAAASLREAGPPQEGDGDEADLLKNLGEGGEGDDADQTKDGEQEKDQEGDKS